MQQNNAQSRIFRDFKHLAREFYSGKAFIAFDTETTGLKAENDYVIEIGAVKFDYTGTIAESFDVLIKPPVEIPYRIQEITHITPQMVCDKESVAQVLPQFLKYIGTKDAVLVAHNAPFDIGFINSELSRSGMSPLSNITMDTLPLARWAYPTLGQSGQKGVYTLQSLASRMGIEVLAAHRANDDARVCMEIFKRIISDTLSVQKDFEIPSQKKCEERYTQMELF